MNDRYGKRAKSASPIRNLPLLLLILVLVVGLVFAVKKTGLFGSAPAEDLAVVSAAAETPEDSSVSHAPAASIISPLPKEESTSAIESQAQVQAQPEPEPEPEENKLPGEGILVCIDPGHGGKDPGCNTDTRLEKDDVLKLGLAMRKSMEAQGMKVIMTREDDTFIKLLERCDIANKAKANYYISVHRNIFEDSSVCGTEIWKSQNASEEASALADNVMAGLEKVGVQRSRGVQVGSQDHNGDYAVLRNSKMPSILLEMGFMQNKKDNKYFDNNIDAYADAITQAVLDTWEEFHVEHEDSAETSAEASAAANA